MNSYKNCVLHGVSIEKEKEALEKELEDLRQNRLNYDHKAEVLNSEIRAVTGANQLVKKQIAAFQRRGNFFGVNRQNPQKKLLLN